MRWVHRILAAAIMLAGTASSHADETCQRSADNSQLVCESGRAFVATSMEIFKEYRPTLIGLYEAHFDPNQISTFINEDGIPYLDGNYPLRAGIVFSWAGYGATGFELWKTVTGRQDEVLYEDRNFIDDGQLRLGIDPDYVPASGFIGISAQLHGLNKIVAEGIEYIRFGLAFYVGSDGYPHSLRGDMYPDLRIDDALVFETFDIPVRPVPGPLLATGIPSAVILLAVLWMTRRRRAVNASLLNAASEPRDLQYHRDQAKDRSSRSPAAALR